MALSEPLCLLLAAYSDEMTGHQVIQLFSYIANLLFTGTIL